MSELTERDALGAALLERYAPMLRGMLARPSRSTSEQMVRLRERMANALANLEAPTTPIDDLRLLDAFLADLKQKMDSAKNKKFAPPPVPPTGLMTPPAARPPVTVCALHDAADSAPLPSLLSIMSAKRSRGASLEEKLMETLCNIMYTHGDARCTPAESAQELLAQLRVWLARLLPHVSAPKEAAPRAASSSDEEAASPEAPKAAATHMLLLDKLSAAFPRERAYHSALLDSRRKAVRSTADVTAPIKSSGALEVDMLGDDVDEADGEGTPQPAGPAGPQATNADEARRAFADARTREMDLDEYDEFCRRRKASGLGTRTFVQWCGAMLGLKGGDTRDGVTEAFSFLGWLARLRTAEVVEAANRAAHQGRLEPLQGPPVTRAQYAATARQLTGLGVGRDRAQ